MNRYYKLQNGDIFDNQTQTTISRDRLLDICNRDDNALDPDWKAYIDKIADLEVKNELDRNKDSVLD